MFRHNCIIPLIKSWFKFGVYIPEFADKLDQVCLNFSMILHSCRISQPFINRKCINCCVCPRNFIAGEVKELKSEDLVISVDTPTSILSLSTFIDAEPILPIFSQIHEVLSRIKTHKLSTLVDGFRTQFH